MPIISDAHTNSVIGLCRPYIELDDGGGYKASPFQLSLWSAWLDFVEKVEKFRQMYSAPVITVANGDTYDGDHHNTSQIITRNPATMHRIAQETLKDIVDMSDQVFVVRGTEAHVGQSGHLEEEFANDVEAVRNPKTDNASWWNLLLNVDGVKLDIAHHGNMGRLAHTEKMAAIKLATQTIMYNADNDVPLPDLVIRSHNHRFADSYDNHIVRGIFTRCWQGKTGYINRLNASAIPDIGSMIVFIENGEYEVEHLEYKLDRPQYFTVEIDTTKLKRNPDWRERLIGGRLLGKIHRRK